MRFSFRVATAVKEQWGSSVQKNVHAQTEPFFSSTSRRPVANPLSLLKFAMYSTRAFFDIKLTFEDKNVNVCMSWQKHHPYLSLSLHALIRIFTTHWSARLLSDPLTPFVPFFI
jgi:hypothetical protein